MNNNIFLGLFLLIILVLTLNPDTELEDEGKLEVALYTEQVHALHDRLGHKGFRIIFQNNCYGYIAHYLNTGEWRDNFCANHYRHLEDLRHATPSN